MSSCEIERWYCDDRERVVADNPCGDDQVVDACAFGDWAMCETGACVDRYDADADVVVDLRTGLAWERSPLTETLTFDAATARCEGLELAWHSESLSSWRLPEPAELRSLAYSLSGCRPIDGGSCGSFTPLIADTNCGTTWTANLRDCFSGDASCVQVIEMECPRSNWNAYEDSSEAWVRCVHGVADL